MKIFGGKLRMVKHTMARHIRAIMLCKLVAEATSSREQDAYLKELIRTLADSLRPFGIILLRFRIPFLIRYSIDERWIDPMLREVKILDDNREVKIKAEDAENKFKHMIAVIAAKMNKTSSEILELSTTDEFERDAIEVLIRDQQLIQDMIRAHHDPSDLMKEINRELGLLSKARVRKNKKPLKKVQDAIKRKFEQEKKELGKPAGKIMRPASFGSLQQQPV